MRRAAGALVLVAIGVALGRVWERVICAAVGHTKPERAWVGDVKHGIHSGYRCGRCGTWAATVGELLGIDDEVPKLRSVR